MPGEGDCVSVDRLLLEDCIALLEEVKDKKLKARKSALLERLQSALKPEENVEANGKSVEDTTDNGPEELYLPMDEPVASQHEVKPTQPDEPEALYLPMDEGEMKNPAEEEFEQEDYVDVETAKDDYLKTQSSQPSASQTSPTASTENLSIEKKKGDKPYGFLSLKKDRKRSSDSNDLIAMPDKATVVLSGYLDYKSGKIGRFAKYWVALCSNSLFFAKSEDDGEAVKVLLLVGKSVDRAKSQFEVKNKKEKHVFKADTVDMIGKWVTALQGAILGTIPSADSPSIELEEETEEDGELYLPMDVDSQPPAEPSPRETSNISPDVDEENYMVPDQLEDSQKPPEEIIEEEYDDVESVRESTKQFLSAATGETGTSTTISPSPSVENVSGKRRLSDRLGFSKKKASDSTSEIAMPEKSDIAFSGYLEYRSGRIGRYNKYWVVLSSSSLFLSKSEEDTEAAKVIMLPGMSVDGSKTGFDVKNSKDRHGFKAESADTASEWVSLLKGILEDTIPEEEESEEERSKAGESESIAPEEEMYDDVESSLNVPSIEITGSANTTPSHRPINSPLPDLPPTPNDASATQTSTASKAKTLIKGTFKDVFGGKGKKSKPTRATSPMPTGNMVMKCGHIYMYKKHTFGGGVWEKRYCVITGEGNLYYSNTDDDADCKGKIPLRGHTDKMKTKDAHGDKKVEEHPYLMLLARNTFAFTTDKDRHEWMEDIKYSTCESLEIDSEEEDEVSGGYNVQSGTMQDADDYDDGDIYEAFDEVTPQTSAPVESKPPDVPAPRTSKLPQPPLPTPAPEEGGIEEELYEDFDEAVNKNTAPALPSRGPPTTGPSLPPRGGPSSTGPSLPSRGAPPTSGPALPPRGPPSSTGPTLPPRNAPQTPNPGPPLPPLPSGNKDPEPVEEIYDDTEGIEQEIYDDVESSVPPPPAKVVPSKEPSPPKQKGSAKVGRFFKGGSPKASNKSPKTSVKQTGGSSQADKSKGNSPKSSPRHSPATSKQAAKKPSPPPDEPEEMYVDVEQEPAPVKQNIAVVVTSKASPLLRKTKAPQQPVEEEEEMYDDVEGATGQKKQDSIDRDDMYMVPDNEDVTTPVAPSSSIKKIEKSQSPSFSPSSSPGTRKLNLPKTTSTSVASPARTRLQSSGKVADMMKKFQQDDGGSEIKCKGRIGHMAPGKKLFQKVWCQLEGKHMTFYQSSRDVGSEPLSKLDVSECSLSEYKEDFNAKFAFKLSVGSVSHKLSCESKREMDKWTTQLKEIVKSCEIE